MPEWPDSYLQTFEAFVADPRSEQHLKDHLDDFLPASPSATELRVLDICAGTGFAGHVVVEHIRSKGHGASLTLLDKSPLILTRELGDLESKIQADVTSMPQILDATYDIIVCRYGFNNLPQEDWLRALNEVLRILKPGGLFLLQDHFVPGSDFSALVNDAEILLAQLEGKQAKPFIFSTEMFNRVLDTLPLVESRIKSGYQLLVDIWARLRAKKELLPDFEAAQAEVLRFYREVCLKKYKLKIVDENEPISIYNITYAIRKKQTP